MALGDFSAEWILRVLGERTAPQNIVTRPEKSASVVHFAAWAT